MIPLSSLLQAAYNRADAKVVMFHSIEQAAEECASLNATSDLDWIVVKRGDKFDVCGPNEALLWGWEVVDV